MVRISVLGIAVGLLAMPGCGYGEPADVPNCPGDPDCPLECPDVPGGSQTNLRGTIFESGNLVDHATVNVIQVSGCAPLATATSGADGKFSVTVPLPVAALVDTHLEVTSVNNLPTHMYLLPSVDPALFELTVLVFTRGTLQTQGMMTSAGQQQVDKGFVIARVYDNGTTTSGATISPPPPPGQVCYESNFLLDCAGTATDGEGFGWIFNVPPGTFDVTGRLSAAIPLRNRRVAVEASFVVQVELERQ
jgi:hypothetical protein